MFCKFCKNNQKVGIGDKSSFLNPESNVYIPIKNSHLVHLLHLNKTPRNDSTQITSVCSEQPTFLNDTTKFNDLLNSNELNNTSTTNGYHLKEASDYTIIYQNLIKLEQPKQGLNEAKTLPLLFFIHGVGGNAKIWSNQLEYFASKGYEIIAIDLLGHGETTSPNNKTNYEFLEMALDVLLIFDMLCKTDNIVIGHSYGCSFATYLGQCRREAISKMILISGGSPHPLDFKSPLLSSPLCFIRLIYPILNCHFYSMAFSSCCDRPTYSNESFNISAKTLLYTMKGQIWRAATEQYHRKISQPVLLIEGEKDKLVPIEDALDMIGIIKYGYLVVVKNGSHMVIIEQFEQINNFINLFLNDSFL